MTLTKPPGYIKLTKASVYTDRAARGIDPDKAITARIEQWKNTAAPGSLVPVHKVINCDPACGCDVHGQTYSCKGSGHGLAAEIVMDILFPPDGSPCAIDGIIGATMHGPLQNPHLVEAYARYVYVL